MKYVMLRTAEAINYDQVLMRKDQLAMTRMLHYKYIMIIFF